MEDIRTLIAHIIKNPDQECVHKYFLIGKHKAQYGSTKISASPKAKEHKLWTPKKGSPNRCYLMIQLINNNFRLTHLFPNEMLEGLLERRGYNNLQFGQPHAYDAQTTGVSQFKGSIDFEQDIEKVRQLIIDITDKTVDNHLNLRGR